MVSEGGIKTSLFLTIFLTLLVAYVQFQVDAAPPAGNFVAASNRLFYFYSQFPNSLYFLFFVAFASPFVLHKFNFLMNELISLCGVDFVLLCRAID